MWFLCLSRSIYFFMFSFFFLVLVFLVLILSDCFFICSVAEVALVVVVGLQDVQSQNMCRRKKFLHSNYNEEQWGLKRHLAHNFPEKKKEKKKNIPSSTNFSHSSCQVLLLCVVASILFASTKIYLLLNQNCKKIKQKERKKVSSPWLAFQYSGRYGGKSGLRVWEVIKLALPFLS